MNRLFPPSLRHRLASQDGFALVLALGAMIALSAIGTSVVYFTTVASGKLVALDAVSGSVLKELDLGPVWSGPSVSRGRVYVGTGNLLFSPGPQEAYFPKSATGTVRS